MIPQGLPATTRVDPRCHVCKRVLDTGEEVWAADFKVIHVSGKHVRFRNETRLTCDACTVEDAEVAS